MLTEVQANFMAKLYLEHGIESEIKSYDGGLGIRYYLQFSEEWYERPRIEQVLIYEDVLAQLVEEYPEIQRILGHWEIEIDVSKASS